MSEDLGVILAGVTVERFLLGCLGAALLVGTCGCGLGGGGAPPPEGITRLESLVSWYRSFRTEHNGKAPANEEEFLKFVDGKMKAAGSDFNTQELVVSPRDKKKYVVTYGKPRPANPEVFVLAYEQEGYDGKKIVAFESSQTREVDDAELKSLLSKQP
jgi:hypothetical protein